MKHMISSMIYEMRINVISIPNRKVDPQGDLA
jgi:hypothetical protein